MPFPVPGDLPDPGVEPMSPAAPVLQVDSLPLSHPGSPFISFDNAVNSAVIGSKRPPALWGPVLNLHPVTFSEVLSRWGSQGRRDAPDQLLLVQQNNKVTTHCTPIWNYSH